jgi:hypothetical protein
MHYFLFKFTSVLNSAFLVWKMLVFEFLLGMSENLLFSMSALQVQIVLFFLEELQLLMLIVGTVTYLEPKLFLLTIFYSGTFVTIKIH